MQKRVSIVVTTIFEPRFLDGYIDDFERNGRGDDTELIVIIDRKTPPSVARKCEELHAAGHRVICPTLDEQEQFLAKFPSLTGRIPYDSDNRRNIGFLMALERGAEILISIDDDNYALADSDFVGEHSLAGELANGIEVNGSDGWFNLCSLLDSSVREDVYARGFPYYARRAQRQVSERPADSSRIAANVGLWLSDPDVDAVTRLALAPRMQSFRGRTVYLGRDSWTPINTQNTAIVRDAIPAYYYVRMGFSVGGMKIDRYGDILSGYFLQCCVKARGEAIRIGSPIADHRRTPHNLFKDLYHELAGMVLLDDLLPWMTGLTLSGSSYAELYANLADELTGRAGAMTGFVWDDGGRDFLMDTASHMRAWLEAVKTIG
jgi:glycosyltransferase involved in cell wall biosynthesis